MGRSMGSIVVGLALLSAAVGCHKGQPILGAHHNMTTPGTIGGILQVAGGGSPIVGRKVVAVGVDGGGRYSAVTSVTGGFSIQVPPGKYHLEVELQQGETVTKDPGTIDINKSDLDANIIVEVNATR
jgi:Carboxypeptidase regulatory-like domain